MKLIYDSAVLIATLLLLMTIIGASAGIYIENNIMTASAIKHNCGGINKETGSFEWTRDIPSN